MGTNADSALQLFYRRRAAMCILTSSSVTGIVRDFKRLAPEDRFDYGVFWFPPITQDPLVCGPFRGVGGVGMSLAITQKNDPAHERRVVDFLMYLTSPEAAQLFVDRTLEDDRSQDLFAKAQVVEVVAGQCRTQPVENVFDGMAHLLLVDHITLSEYRTASGDTHRRS